MSSVIKNYSFSEISNGDEKRKILKGFRGFSLR